MFPPEEKTPPCGPFAIHLARIESKIDLLGERQDEALSKAFQAHQIARSALLARQTWAPYAFSLALAFATALIVIACSR